MNPIDKLKYWLINDPTAKTKALFFMTIFMVILVAGTSIISTNFSQNTSKTSSSSSSSSKSSEPAQVTATSFEDAKSLEKVDNEPVSLGSQVLFTATGNTVFLNRDLKLRINNQNVSSSPVFVPRQLYNSSSGIIINGDANSTIYGKNNQFSEYPKNITQVTPISITDDLSSDFVAGFVFLSKDKTEYTIKQSQDVELKNNVKTLGKITPSSVVKTVEIRVLNNQVYIITYSTFSPEGNIDIWQVEKGSLNKIQTLKDVKAIRFGPKQILYTTLAATPTDYTFYQSTLVDFSQKNKGESKIIDLAPRLAQNNIKGTVFARRCTFGLNETISCLVKKDKVVSDNFQKKDALVVYNYNTDKITFPFSELTFSGDNIHISPNSSIYIIGQENKILYRLKS